LRTLLSTPPTTPPPRPRLNPARLSELAALFRLPVVATELRGVATELVRAAAELQRVPAQRHAVAASAGTALERAVRTLLSEREWDGIHDCAERRMVDFCAGRLCAHRALAEFGIGDFDLLARADRQPVWPPGLTGSITHTEGYSAAVVGERSRVAALGIDAECVSAVRADLWPAICGTAELERLRTLAPEAQAPAAALTFAAKEAFFKCQYPLAAERFEFGEVQLEEAEWQAASGSFRLAVERASRLDQFLPRAARRRIEGRFRRQGPYVIAGLGLAPI
jgi:4'-phosphopantetheinyl transferase EntD